MNVCSLWMQMVMHLHHLQIIPLDFPRAMTSRSARTCRMATTLSNALLQCCHGVCFGDLLGGLGLDHDNLTEDFPFACFGCWLCADFQPRQTWDSKDTGLFHPLRCDACKSIEQFGGHFLFQLAPACQRLRKRSLRHRFSTSLLGCFHRNWQHGATERCLFV